MEKSSEVYRRNNNGPKTLPCGTPDTTLTSLLRQPSTITWCDRFDRNSVNIDRTKPKYDLMESKYDFDWIKMILIESKWFWLNQNMILIESKYDFDWIKMWFWLNQNMILIKSKYNFLIHEKPNMIILYIFMHDHCFLKNNCFRVSAWAGFINQ